MLNMEQTKYQVHIEIAWQKLAEAIALRDLKQLTKNFFWIRRLYKDSEIKY